ncbi:DgyrCDS11757 [Dimorphilus gyrociliatus]|uniref:DgyrCDS11757 n=1 Tax=Dimorphilus gyrociliatus TaxID=2664684 RepID=A0A7I8W4E4_9ANNE|nr:DgyrCDS11757 [Dimorphilus gyrociliatus]
MECDQVLLALGASAIAKYLAMYFMENKKPDNLEYVGKISSLKLFPVKSLGEIDIKRANCTKMGLEYEGFFDRRWVLIDSANKIITMRECPKLCYVSCNLSGENVIFSAPDHEDLIVNRNLDTKTSPLLNIQIHGDPLKAYDCGDVPANWFAAYINDSSSRIRLLYAPPGDTGRFIVNNKKATNFSHRVQEDDEVGTSDQAPYLLITSESLKDLEGKVGRNLDRSFRPNIVVSGSNAAFDEDDWDVIYIGDARFKTWKYCGRCVLTTVDHDEGIRDPKAEPLMTLRKYRMIHSADPYNPIFGLYLANEKKGEIKVALGASSALKYAVMYFMKDRKPNNLEYVGRISSLNLYPVKSLQEVSILQANCTKKGLEYNGFFDRRWALIDKNDKLITLREIPKLCLISCKVSEQRIIFSTNEQEDLSIDLELYNERDNNSKISIDIWDDYVDVFDCGEKPSEWFSRYCNQHIRLVYSPPGVTGRYLINSVNEDQFKHNIRDDDEAGTANDGPYLLTTQESFQDVDRRVDRSLNPSCFRSNIIINGTREAFDEDNWDLIFIGDAKFKVWKLCGRCSITTVMLDTGVKDLKFEPLTTLRKYRIRPEISRTNPIFGINLVLMQSGSIAVGDKVFVKRLPKINF